MKKPPPPQAAFARELRAYTKGATLAIYLIGIPKPLRDLTVCQVTEACLVGRWNSSTHLIPIARIAYARYEADCDPCRDRHHTLNHVVNRRFPPPGPRPNQGDRQEEAPPTTAVGDIIGGTLQRIDQNRKGDTQS